MARDKTPTSEHQPVSPTADNDPLADNPFDYRETKDGKVQITHHGRQAITLKGREAARFMTRVASADARGAQLLMAKATGQYKFGNERIAKERGRGQ